MSVTHGLRIPLNLMHELLDPRELQLIVLPTEHCNFRCTYCYEDFKIGRMKPSIVEGIKNLLCARSLDLDVLEISWFGGEPSLAADIVLDVTSFANELMRKQGKVFRSGMTTNGYTLNAALFTKLLTAGVNYYQISLDGPREVHNKTRQRADGHGTFDQIWANLREIAQLVKVANTPDFHILLRVHYDASTAYQLESLLDSVNHDLGLGRHFSLHMHEIERLGGPNDNAIVPPNDADHAVVRSLLSKYGQRPDGKAHTLVADMDNYICYASRANSLLVRADGRIGKCTVALKDERNTIGHINADGTIEISDERMRPWLRGIFSGDLSVLACPRAGMPEKELIQISRQ